MRVAGIAKIITWLMTVAVCLAWLMWGAVSGQGCPRSIEARFMPARVVDERLKVAWLAVAEDELSNDVREVLRGAVSSSYGRLRGGDGKGSVPHLAAVDDELAKAASRGAGYAGSMNLTRDEARAIGASIGCDFYFLIRAETVRRSSSDKGIYFEALSRVMLVDGQDGRLLKWEFINAERTSADEAIKSLLQSLKVTADNFAQVWLNERLRSHQHIAERLNRAGKAFDDAPFVIIGDEAEAELDNHSTRHTPSDFDLLDVSGNRNERSERTFINESEKNGRQFDNPNVARDKTSGNTQSSLRAPQPYRRLRPAYTATASQAEAQGTVDAEVFIDATGQVIKIEIVRWAGFGLDEAVIETINRMHFRPAMRANTALPSRILLRYNFKR